MERLLYFTLCCIVLVRTEQSDVTTQSPIDDCKLSVTTASGTLAPKKVCSGELIFEDEFDQFDLQKWWHENTLAGGGNWEFQWYTNNRTNSLVRNGTLFITPTLTADQFGEDFLTSGTLDVNGATPTDVCTNPSYYGCMRVGTKEHVVNPVKSARISTVNSFSFKYGRVEVRAKLPTGDWLWPAIWFMPRYNAYGTWPASGEIDLMESRGNEKLTVDGKNIGVEMSGATLHFGPDSAHNAYKYAHFEKNTPPNEGFNQDFHKYTLEWTPDYIRMLYDDEEVGKITPSEDGFWGIGKLNGTGLTNIWENGTKMAPFDQEFYVILNLAVGGVAYFPDNADNPSPKPWKNSSHKALTDFWNGRENWLSTWKLSENNSARASLQVDYVRVYAL